MKSYPIISHNISTTGSSTNTKPDQCDICLRALPAGLGCFAYIRDIKV